MLLASILLSLAWASLHGEFSLFNLVGGYVLAYVVLSLLAAGGVLPRSFATRSTRVVALAGFFLREMLLANLRVAIDVLRPRDSLRPAVIAVPLDVTTDHEILLLSALLTFTPGSVTIDLSDDGRTLYVHVMHMTSPDAVRRDIKDGFERRVLAVFERGDDTPGRG